MKKQFVFPLVLLVLLVVSAAGNYYLWTKYKAANDMLNNPDAAAQKEAKAITSKIAAFMDLPTDEEPTVATVLDKDKLKDQAFFASAENGDKVLIYSKNKKAILYRPEGNKVIDVAPLTMAEPSPSATATPKASVKASPSPSPVSEE